MNTKSNNFSTSTDTELVRIGGIGFMFEVIPNLKHNLISPDVLAFFEGVQESCEVTKDCAFPVATPYTNISSSLFQYIGYESVSCYDGVSRKCQRIRCKVEYNGNIETSILYLDNSLMGSNIKGVIHQFQSEMINNEKYLHIVPSDSSAGALKQVLNKGVQIAYIELDLSTGCLPGNLSKEEYLRCKEHELLDFGDGLSYKLFGTDLSKYDGIVVWHSKDIESMLLLALISSAYEGIIYHIDVSKIYGNCICGEICPEQLSLCLKFATKLSNMKKYALKSKYDALPHSYPCVKRYIRGNIEIIEKEVLKKRLLRNVKNKPQCWRVPSSYTMAKSRLGEYYSSVFWDCLTLELLCEGRAIISDMNFKRNEFDQYPLGCCMKIPYLYNGFDLRKLYSFKYFKVNNKSHQHINNSKR